MRQVLADALRAARRSAADTSRRTRRQVGDDLRTDPYLPSILLLAAVVMGFWIWHRLPNFATRDERWRVVDPVETLAPVLEKPGVEAFYDGLTTWRTYGATMYLSGLALVPVVVVVIGTGQLDAFADMGRHTDVGNWVHWQRTPAWIWTGSVLAARLANVLLAVGCVYVLYRLGTTIKDRATGRLAALLGTFTWALVILAHEAGEDVPSLFFFLLAVYFAVRYLEDGSRRLFYLGCLCGGAAIAFKLSGGVSAVVLGAAHLLRARRADGSFASAVWRPDVLAGGILVALATIAVGYPSIIFGAPSQVGGRISRAVSAKSSAHGWRVEPSWWWILRGYLHGAGLPLFLAMVGSVLAVLPRLRTRSQKTDGLALSLVGVATFLTVYSGWSYVRTHHLLPTLPLLVLVVAVVLTDLMDSRPRIGRVVVAGLVVTTAVYAGAGTLAYADQPKDRASAWLSSHAEAGDRLETYVLDPQESAAPHGMNVSYEPPGAGPNIEARCPEYVEFNYHMMLSYLADDDSSLWADRHSAPWVERYVRDMLAEDTYPYEVAERFGRQPHFMGNNESRPAWREMLRVGIRPRTIQYGDPQDMGVDQYTIVLRRTGECTPDDS